MDPQHLNIALIAGGYSGEMEVSLRSQEGLLHFLSDSPHTIYPMLITHQEWSVSLPSGEKVPVHKDDFSIHTPQGKHIKFDFAYITIHGTPGENGLLTGYLDMLRIPYSCCSTLVSALTFDKYVCNRYLSTFGIRTTSGIRLGRHDTPSVQSILRQVPLPVFVKPCNGGSSVATHKVVDEANLLPAIQDALKEDVQVLIERVVQGTEVTCGCYRDDSGIHTLPVTEVVSRNEFFDYDAKYNGAVEEITPARISSELTAEIQSLTSRVYTILQAQGIIRIDYIIHEDKPYLLEVNTTPGMTATSFIPQQIRAAGLKIGEVLDSIITYIIHYHSSQL